MDDNGISFQKLKKSVNIKKIQKEQFKVSNHSPIHTRLVGSQPTKDTQNTI